jgi:predicted Zn-dependent protease
MSRRIRPWEKARISRREFLIMSGASTAAILTGCATNPVTGKSQFMLVSQDGEINVDRINSPHQISADYGTVQDSELNRYLTTIGERLASHSHRPNMPYTFRAVNAVNVNAYAFPGGTIAVTRGMLLGLQSEAELAAVLGHEIGHVASRHSASNMSKGMVLNVAMAVGSLALDQFAPDYSALGSGLGGIMGGALLAHYSRTAEREADALALEYMTRAKYNPDGCVAVMDILRKLQKDKPNIIELMFATHPMSEERYQTAVETIRDKYQAAKTFPVNKEQYMDQTARIRAIKNAIDQFQKGAEAMGENKLNDAAGFLEAGLKLAPQDYAGLLMLANCRLTQKQWQEAERLAGEAQAVYPREPMSLFVSGLARIAGKRFDGAYDAFSRYDQLLPGNPNTIFYKGFSQEGMGRRQAAAELYQQFLQQVQQGDHAEYAYRRLVQWGYIKPQQK